MAARAMEAGSAARSKYRRDHFDLEASERAELLVQGRLGGKVAPPESTGPDIIKRLIFVSLVAPRAPVRQREGPRVDNPA